MGQWKGESQHQDGDEVETLKTTIHDVSSLESETKKICNVNLPASTPTICQIGLENISNNVGCTSSTQKLLQNLSKADMEQIRKTMIKQEELFKEQVQALHKLYNIQRLVMNEIRKTTHIPAKISAFHTVPIQGQDEEGLTKEALKPGCVAASRNFPESHIISTVTHKSISLSVLTEQDFLKNSGQKLLWDGDKLTDSSVITKTPKRTIDLERPPEEYMDDVDDVLKNEQAETREAEGPDQGTADVSDTIAIEVRQNHQPCLRAELKEKHSIPGQREWFRTDVGLLSEENKYDDTMVLKQPRQLRDQADLLTEMKPAMTVNVGQQTSTPVGVQCLSGRIWLPEQLNEIDEEGSHLETTGIDQVGYRKKEKLSADTEVENKHHQINSKPPLWLPQASTTCTRSTSSNSCGKPIWMQAPTFTQPEGWDFVASSKDCFGPGQEILSPPKDVKLPGTMQNVDSKTVNQEAQSCGEPARIQEVTNRQPNGASVTVIGSHTYGSPIQVTPVLFTQGYPVGAAFPAVGVQWSLEGQPALAAQGFVFPTVNKSITAGPVSHPALATWYSQGTSLKFYQYQQHTVQDHGFPAPCQNASQTATQNILDGSHRQSDIEGKPTSQAEHFESSLVPMRQSHDESSSVNWPARSSRVSSFSPPKPSFEKHDMENVGTTLQLKLASNENLRDIHLASKISNSQKNQLGDSSKLFAIEEKRQIDDKTSRCSNHGLEAWQAEGQIEKETSRDYRHGLQITEVIPTREAIWSQILIDESRKGDTTGFKPSLSCEQNCSLISKSELQTRDIPHGEGSTGQTVSESLKELELFTHKMLCSKTSRLEKHGSAENSLAVPQTNENLSQLSECSNVEGTLPIDGTNGIPNLSLGKDEIGIKALKKENCTLKIAASKESYRNEDLDCSGHGSNSMIFLEGKLSRGEDTNHLLNHKETHTGSSSERNATKQPTDDRKINMDLGCIISESLPLKRTECAMTDKHLCSDGLHRQASISSALPSDDFLQDQFKCHGRIEESITRNGNYVKSQGSALASKIGVDKLDVVKQVESGSGETTMGNIETGKCRYNGQNENFTDIQIISQQIKHAQSTCAETHLHNHRPELQADHPKEDMHSSKGKSSEATESHQESSTCSQGSEEISEEICENLAAKILLSLAPSNSQIKGTSKTSAPSPKKGILQQQRQFGFQSTLTLPRQDMKDESSHSSRDSSCHSNVKTCPSRGNLHTHRSLNFTQADTCIHETVSWIESVRGRRRRTQRPRTYLVSPRKNK